MSARHGAAIVLAQLALSSAAIVYGSAVLSDAAHGSSPVTDTPLIVRVLPMCATDESGIRGPRCVWDARHTGNGAGRSFVRTRNGTVHYVTHTRAHLLAGLSS